MTKSTKTKSYAPQVIADSSGKFVGNALRFAHEQEALNYGKDLAFRWTLVRELRVVESDDPVNYRYVDGELVEVKPDEPEPEPKLKCSICALPIEPHPLSGWAHGNNAQPVNSGRCCDDCNASVVIPARLMGLMARQKS